MKLKLFAFLILSLVLIGVLVRQSRVSAKEDTPSSYREYSPNIQSGKHNGDGVGESLVFSTLVEYPEAPWLRLHIGEYSLKGGSYIRLESLEDGSTQTLNETSLPDWDNYSAYFNGDAVRVELYAAPGASDVYVEVDHVLAGNAWPADRTGAVIDAPDTLCEGDDRVASDDNRVGRLTDMTWPGFAFCTAWLTSNGSLLTAGHCVDGDPDLGGPMLPDGTMDWTTATVVEFEVPDSTADGQPVFSAADNQYPVDLDSVSWNFNGQGVAPFGSDWAVFRVNRNANTNRLPHHVYGFFRTIVARPVDFMIRITGYGGDQTPLGTGTPPGANAQSQTNQTSTGPYIGHLESEGGIAYFYRTDSEGGNSGGPIIWEETGAAVGIHTNGGCNDEGAGNSGTAFELETLERAIQIMPGTDTVYVDRLSASIQFFETGAIFQPFDTVAEGISEVPKNGVVSIVEGTYDETLTIDHPMTLEAPVGVVTIGE